MHLKHAIDQKEKRESEHAWTLYVFVSPSVLMTILTRGFLWCGDDNALWCFSSWKGFPVRVLALPCATFGSGWYLLLMQGRYTYFGSWMLIKQARQKIGKNLLKQVLANSTDLEAWITPTHRTPDIWSWAHFNLQASVPWRALLELIHCTLCLMHCVLFCSVKSENQHGRPIVSRYPNLSLMIFQFQEISILTI